MVEPTKLEVMYSGNHSTINYDFQDDVNIRIDPLYLIFTCYEVSCYKEKI